MVRFSQCIVVVMFLLLTHSCMSDRPNATATIHTVRLQPFEGFSQVLADSLANSFRQIFGNVVVDSAQPLPLLAYNKSRNRYRADVLIQSLARFVDKGTLVIGLTHYDISTTKAPYPDWGVMGLGYQPGSSCVVSTYRLKRKTLADLHKVAVHELGHNTGLPHCKDDHCYMRDANGGYPLDQLTEFCSTCRLNLKQRGWRIK